jgi:hypothetical protein
MRPCIPSCAVVHRDARAPHFLPARNIDCMHNIAITARAQHYTVRAAPAQCTCIPACALRERSGTREVEVLRCFRAQCLPSLSKTLTSVRWSRRHLAKNISSALHPQRRRTTEHVARTFLVSQSSRTCPRGCALDPRSLRLAPSSLRLTGRGCAAQPAQLPRACCKLEGSITTARLRHAGGQHGCAAQAALARSSLAEDGSLRCSCRPADPRRLLTADPAAGGRVHGNSAIHRH